MLMKDGSVVPEVFVQSLEKDFYVLKVFLAMSETYQRLYVKQITNPQSGDSMRVRIDRTMDDIRKYGEDNNIK